jgi:ketosteroid isomerase-like protein
MILPNLAANFGPQGSAERMDISWAAAAPPVGPSASSAGAQALPPQRPQATPQMVISEHFAAFNACDWKRLMAQYADDMAFLSKDGAVVKGRQAIGEMFSKALQPHSAGGVCGLKLTPEQTIVVGDTVNVIWRADAPFLAEPYRGSEAFETRHGLLVVQVTTWDPPAMKMSKQR